MRRYQLFLRRCGVNPHNHHSPLRDVVWTKGGCWWTASTFTQLLVLKRHLPPRRRVLRWQKRLSDEAVRLLESELMNLIDPDVMFSYEAKQLALEYVRRRLGQLQGWTKRRVSLAAVAWFFDHSIPDPGHQGTVAPHPQPGYTTGQRRDPHFLKMWAW